MPDMSDDAALTRGEFREFQTRLFAQFTRLDARFDRVDSRFDEVDARFRDVYTHLEGLTGNYEWLQKEYHLIIEGLRRVEGRLGTLETGQQDLVAAVHRLEERLSRVEHRLEVIAPFDAPDLREQLAELRVRVDRLELEVRESKGREKQ